MAELMRNMAGVILRSACLLFTALVAGVLISSAAWGDRGPVLLAASGEGLVLAQGAMLYHPDLSAEPVAIAPLANVGRGAITALAASADTLYAAVGRTLYVAAADGSNMRSLGRVAGSDITALAFYNGTLYLATGESIETLTRTSAEGEVPALTSFGKAPGSIHSMYVAADGVYAAVGHTLWRLRKGEPRDRIVDAPAAILGVSGGNRNVYYACRAGKNVVVCSADGSHRWTVPGVKEIDGFYFDAARRAIFYSGADARGNPHLEALDVSRGGVTPSPEVFP